MDNLASPIIKQAQSVFMEPSTDSHIILNGQSFVIPYELLQRNYKQFNIYMEKESMILKKRFKELNTLLDENTLDNDKIALKKLNTLIKNVMIFEKQLDERVERESELLHRIEKRILFFQDLKQFKENSDETALIDWYQKYSNVLIADYLTRNCTLEQQSNIENNPQYKELYNTNNPGVMFLKQQQLEGLLDYDVLIIANDISQSLLMEHNLEPLMAWIEENKEPLTRKDSNLEFKTNFQQYVELLRENNIQGAIKCLQTGLFRFMNDHFEEITTGCGLLVYIDNCLQQMKSPTQINKNSETIGKNENSNGSSMFNDPSKAFEYFFHKRLPVEVTAESSSLKIDGLHQIFNSKIFESYTSLLDAESWVKLNDLFLEEYYSLYGISKNDPLLVYISLGISTLKTKKCLHSAKNIPSEFDIINRYSHSTDLNNKCPVCSKFFAPMSEQLPYAHHTQSKLFENPVMLPSGNVYDAKRLKKLAKILAENGLRSMKPKEVLDPIEKAIYKESDFVTMYPT